MHALYASCPFLILYAMLPLQTDDSEANKLIIAAAEVIKVNIQVHYEWTERLKQFAFVKTSKL